MGAATAADLTASGTPGTALMRWTSNWPALACREPNEGLFVDADAVELVVIENKEPLGFLAEDRE